MHFRTILSFICLFLALNLKSQSLSFGVHAIGNYSSFQEPKTLSLARDLIKYKFGYGIGGNVTKNLGQHFDILAELNFERKGAVYDIIFKDENGNPTSNSKPAKHFDYLSLPVLLQLKYGEKKGIVFQLGTSMHYLVQYKFENGMTGEAAQAFHKFDNISHYNRIDQSVIGGVGFFHNIGDKQKLYANGRFFHGINELSSEELIYSVGKNTTFQLIAGVQF